MLTYYQKLFGSSVPSEGFILNKVSGNAHLMVMHCGPIAGGWWIAQGNGRIKGIHPSPIEHNKGK